MWSLVGTLAVLAATAGSVVLVIRGVRAARTDADAAVSDLRTPVLAVLGAAVVAMLALEGAILTNDFTVSYVADNHSTATPFPYDIATAWAALEGSIVLWGLVLAGFTWAVLRDHERRRDRLGAGALAVMGVVAIFFFGLMATVANPFETCVDAGVRSCEASSVIPLVGAEGPENGRGPNPLLQNHPFMSIHPPLLYLGYVGLTVPFAYAISALGITLPGSEWLRRSKRWTQVAWTFLTAGILIGGWWAYEVLSWGGYWTWDPVENASFMPWLAATAFLHSALVQERRGMLQAWNFVLVIAAFSLTILGTFLTRSGTIASVHSFTQSAIGPALLGFLVFVLVGSFALFALRAQAVAQPSRLDALASREGTFLVNNLLLSLYALVVLVGTIYPIVLEAFTGDRVRVGAPFFNRLAVPLSFALLLFMGLGPVTPWRAARPRLVWERIHGPLQAALAVGALVVLTTSRVGWVVVAAVLATFVVAVPIRHLWDQARRAAAARNTGLGAELRRVVAADLGYWGGQLSHIGVALVVVGIAFASNLAVHNEVELTPQESVPFAGYQLTYLGPFSQDQPNKTVQGATVAVARDGEVVTRLEPRLNQFEASTFAIGTPAVHTTWGGDLYLTLLSVDTQGITLRMDTSPLMWMVWLGGLVAAAGGAVSMRGRSRSRTRPRELADA